MNKKKLALMIHLLVFVTITCYSLDKKEQDNQYKIHRIKEFPLEYIERNNSFKKNLLTIRPEKNWVLNFTNEIYLESKISGEKIDNNGMPYLISTLYLVFNGNRVIVDSEVYSFGRVSWNTNGDRFIYMRIEVPPADYSIGDVYLVSIDYQSNKVEKRLIVKNIGSSDFRWALYSNLVAFADFEAVYVLDADSGKYTIIRGEWAEGLQSYEKGTGYPRLCNSFIWLNSDKNLY